MLDSKSLVVLAVQGFEGNPNDSKTIEPLLNQVKENLDYQPKEVVYDRGGRGPKEINGVKISMPQKASKKHSAYQKQKLRKKFRRRAAIEPVIGHLKSEHRMKQNYLLGEYSPTINAKLAAMGWNLKKMMNQLKEKQQELENKIKNSFFLISKFSFFKNNKPKLAVIQYS